MKKVLVIGASGSIGQGFVKSLESKYAVTATYNNTPIEFNTAKVMGLDITKKSSFEKLPTDFDIVYLIAGAMPAAMKGYTEQTYIDVNITGTLNVLNYCKENKITKIVYIMTFSDVSANFYTGVPIEDDQKRSLNYTGDHALYAISKVSAHELLKHFNQEYGIQTVIFRIPTVYCNDDNINYYVDGVLREKSYIKMIKSISENNKIEIWGDLSNAKDMPYIKDFSRLLESVIYNDSAVGVYNAGTGQPISLDDFVNSLIKVFSKGEVIKEYFPEKPSQPNFTFNMDKTKKEFGYEPSYTLHNMLLEIKEELVKKGIING